jgi:serine/threonine-protein phosphatase 2B regulatory subunit
MQLTIQLILLCEILLISYYIIQPDAPISNHLAVAFKLYDLKQQGFIEKQEVSSFYITILSGLYNLVICLVYW